MTHSTPSRMQRPHGVPGVTPHLTFERRQLRQASLISLMSPQGICEGTRGRDGSD